jgi:hypothetical protein
MMEVAMAIDTPYSLQKAGRDRFAVTRKGLDRVIGYVASNADGTWSVEHKGKKLAEVYYSIGEAATALMSLTAWRRGLHRSA